MIRRLVCWILLLVPSQAFTTTIPPHARTCLPAKGSEHNDDLQDALNELMQPPTDGDAPMWAGFDSDRIDETALPIPLFTSMVILLGTTYLTVYLLYYGIVGLSAEDQLPGLL
uniref:Uncharacterized protein n=1 Tax=Craspedostauros australis TaxID=1486917 RepID=A0A7R9WN72_9STRA|mmetsp:Transcript_12777/g.35292  ORF Transcript_12777/g.35292 Transcript_12777/m.35292 type:complete len:113 (+) Transcript_12777:155-493(+)